MSKIADIVVPNVGESVTQIFEVRILKNVGEYVSKGGVIIEGDSDKASIEIVSTVTGQVAEILATEGEDFDIGQVIARVEEKEIPEEAKTPAVEAGPSESVVETSVTQEVETSAPAPEAKAPETVTTGGEKRVKMTPLRRTIAKRLVEAQQTAAMLTTFNEADMSAIFALRKKYQDRFVDRHGTKLGFMSFFLKAVIDALQEYPAVNAEIDGNYIVYKKLLQYWRCCFQSQRIDGSSSQKCRSTVLF